MSSGPVRIAEKRGEAQAARDRLVATVEEIKRRLAPRTIAHDAWEEAKDRSAAAADTAVTTIKERPTLFAGVAAGAALILARKPIVSLLTGLFRDNEDEPDRADETSKE